MKQAYKKVLLEAFISYIQQLSYINGWGNILYRLFDGI